MARTWGQKVEEAIPILTLGAGLLALFFGIDNWWVIFVVGWIVLTPLADILVDDVPAEASSASHGEPAHDHASAEGTEQGEDTADALDTLRDRYARGELTEAEFERKVERLLETETVEGAREHVGGGRDRASDRAGNVDRETDREPDRVEERESDRELDREESA